jgi:hypothetical protein
MTDQHVEERKLLAKALMNILTPGWTWAEDNVPPPEARLYAIYDGLRIMGGGYSMDRVAGIVSACKMPLVLYRR